MEDKRCGGCRFFEGYEPTNIRKREVNGNCLRFPPIAKSEMLGDDSYGPKQKVRIVDNGQGMVEVYCDGARLGDRLSDNHYVDDGYRFHDVFHFSNAAVLGWSPITRWMLKRKRKSDPRTDEVEDGGRAIAIEEGISAMVFNYAEQHNFLANNQWVSTDLLRTIKGMTSHLEVSRCTIGDWERAIHAGFDAWRLLNGAGYANLLLDLDRQFLSVLPQE